MAVVHVMPISDTVSAHPVDFVRVMPESDEFSSQGVMLGTTCTGTTYLAGDPSDMCAR
jgi:hypothetical protein